MGCETDQLCAEPQRARKQEAPVIQSRIPADKDREVGKKEAPGVDRLGMDEDTKNFREDTINVYKSAVDKAFDAFNKGIDNAKDRIAVSDKVRESQWAKYLGIAVGALIAGSGGTFGAWVGAMFEGRLVAKFVGDVIKDAITKSFKPEGSRSQTSEFEIKAAFIARCEDEATAAELAFLKSWPSTAARLRTAPTDSLVELPERYLAVEGHRQLIHEVEQQVLVGWTNFVARAVHGGMGGWDPWQRNGREGATPLKGAAPNPFHTPEERRVDPMLSNVDPKQMYWAVDADQRTMEDTHVGILEIHLWRDGKLNIEPDYGMRLDNVGPHVREAFKTSGKRVRDLAVNKVVRVSNVYGQINPPRTDGAFLITADGHIRLTGWALPHAELVPTAEHAQDLPLSWLKV